MIERSSAVRPQGLLGGIWSPSEITIDPRATPTLLPSYLHERLGVELLDQAHGDAPAQWEALTRFLQDGELEIDNGATERANRDIALGRLGCLGSSSLHSSG